MDGLTHHAGNPPEVAGAVPRDRSPEVELVEQRYRRLVDHSPDAIVVHVGGRLVYVNGAAVRWMAADRSEQLVGHLITDFVHPDSIGPMLARIADIRGEGDASDPSEAVMLRVDGTTLDVEAVSVLTVWKGKPAYQVIFRDLTAQKAAQATLSRVEQHFQTVVASLDHGVAVLERDGRVASFNPAAQRILGVPDAEVVPNRPYARGLDFPIYDLTGDRIGATGTRSPRSCAPAPRSRATSSA